MSDASNFQIARHLRRVPSFRGVYSKDELARLGRRHGGLYVINLQNSKDGGGTHWVALMVVTSGPRHSVYADPYGAPPPDVVLKFASTPTRPLYYSTALLQGLTSGLCGAFASYFVNELAKRRPIAEIVGTDFTDSPTANGKTVMRFWRRSA